MSLPKKIKIEDDSTYEKELHISSSSNNQNQLDYSLVKIKNEPETIHDGNDALQYHPVASISNHVDETTPVDGIHIKTEITVEETKVEQYSEFEKNKLKFRCKLCDFRSSWRQPLWEHSKYAHPEESTAKCTICFVKFKGESNLEKHIDDEHQGLGNKCKICSSYYKRGRKNEHWTQCFGRLLFMCNTCEQRYVTKEGLIKHMVEHDLPEEFKESSTTELRVKLQVYSCEICKDDRAYGRGPFKEHTKKQHDGRYLKCANCDKTFDRLCNRSKHMKQCCTANPKRINTEEVELPGFSQSSKNRNAHNNIPAVQQTKSFNCDECEITVENSRALRYHRINHHQQSLLSCSYCPKQFPNKTSLHRHMASHQSIVEQNEKKKFECQHCFKQFDRFHYFDKHIKLHDTRFEIETNKNNKIKHEVTIESSVAVKKSTDLTKRDEFACKFCNFGFGSKTTLRTHIRKTHPDERSFLCDICRGVFNGSTELDKHIAEAHDGLGKKCRICLTQFRRDQQHDTNCLGRQLFNCDHCNISFLRKEGIWKHLDEHGVQEDVKESSISVTRIKQQFFNCEICGDDRAYRKDFLSEHTEEQHGGHYALCPNCGKTFKNINHRRVHLQKYCRIGPARERYKSEKLECSVCTKIYQNRASLEDHVARYHRKNPYQCSLCKMNFSNASEVQQHKIKTHLEFTFSCTFCARKFKFNHELQKHMRSHNKQKDS